MFENNSLISEISERLEKDERLVVRCFNLIAEALRESNDDDFNHHYKFLKKLVNRNNFDIDEIEEMLMESDLHKGIYFYEVENQIQVQLDRYKASFKKKLYFYPNDLGSVKTLDLY